MRSCCLCGQSPGSLPTCRGQAPGLAGCGGSGQEDEVPENCAKEPGVFVIIVRCSRAESDLC